jgi:glutamate synthase domain-containing protein 2/glutamate synthase domain-containing protein 1/glutamate synthase domain-containing protein 3
MADAAVRRPPHAPLYDPRFEHDACGVGFVAESTAGPSTRVVPLALAALAGLTHRGAIAADAKTGDGAGLAIPLTAGHLARLARDAGVALDGSRRSAVGMVFLPFDEPSRSRGRQIVERAVAAEGLEPLGWRSVPIDEDVLGPSARESRPAIEQLIVAAPTRMTRLAFERALLLARRSAEWQAGDEGLDELSVISLSGRTVVYKGLFVGSELGRFYRDLADPSVAVAYAVFHQRYSTNTHPSWRLAHPFRFLAHNGEINTVRGNRVAMDGRAATLGGGALGRRLAAEFAAGRPLLDPTGSDSASLAEAAEFLVAAGWSIDAALLALVPEAPDLRTEPLPGLKAWQREIAARVEPWDGPAALVFSDGRRVGVLLDRNGLRPAAAEIRRDGLVVVASEAGLLDVEPGEVVQRLRLEPGGLLVVDTVGRRLLQDAAAKTDAFARAPRRRRQTGGGVGRAAQAAARERVLVWPPRLPVDPHEIQRQRLVYGLDAEQVRIVVRAMATTGREPIWSMGDDTPLAVLARRPRAAAAYLRQSFAQVTNPPIDPDRERIVMSLALAVGRRPRLLDPLDAAGARDADGHASAPASTVTLSSPVLDRAGRDALFAPSAAPAPWSTARLDATWPAADPSAGLAVALDRLAKEAVRRSRSGATLLVLDDASAGPGRLPIPSVLAVGAVHVALTRAGRRGATDIAVDAGDAFDVHQVAMLVAAGASAVHPRTALALAEELAGTRGHEDLSGAAAQANVVAALELGLRKVLARMGISTLASYRGSQLFEAIGLDRDLVDRCFPAAAARYGSTGAQRLGEEIAARAEAAYAAPAAPNLPDPGFVRFRGEGEMHAFAPTVVKATQALANGHSLGVGPGTALAAADETTALHERLNAYRSAVDRSSPLAVRELLRVRRNHAAIPLQRVEPASAIVTRFVSSAMSLGSLSPEAHQALAVGMRLLGGASNTGEGGEDPAWYVPGPDGRPHDSAIKQVASARFGVTADYLARAEQLEIKMAQGSKPGEGGQLPGAKVTELIATLRRGQPGMTMISPPPHHDIYSIEDLAQLIADLRAINPTARIGVKLVATVGVGTIAAGVAKAHADYVLVSGHSGGTGASPLASIKHAGLPWELGLAEAHQVLVRQGLRDRVALRTDGGLQTGRDLLIAALLGAEEYGFGTMALIAMGCDMARQCHLDTCPTGIATQREDLRAKFTGRPEQIVELFSAIAEDLRRELAAAGFRSVEEAVGRVDRLEAVDASPLDLGPILGGPAWVVPAARRGRSPRQVGRISDGPAASALDGRLAARVLDLLPERQTVRLGAAVSPAERAVGAVVSGDLARRGRVGPDAGGSRVELALTGAAGQSFGAFAGPGVSVRLDGVANDYVGKGLSGGSIVVRPTDGATFDAGDQAIAGNACLYGATGGSLHLVGRAGMRFAVRNSGAQAVVEGVGAHGCEYMTGGTVVVLGAVGRNFGAGMTGGSAWLWDPEATAGARLDRTSVCGRHLIGSDDSGTGPLRALLAAHAETGSIRAAAILARWPTAIAEFLAVEPVAAGSAVVASLTAEPTPAGLAAAR